VEASIVGLQSASPRIRRGSGGGILDPLLVLERREKAIHNDLQLLLDAQSTGLVQGFGGEGGGKEGCSDAGSSTPTMRSGSRKERGGVVPVRQPKRRVVGLRGARRGLLRDMGGLVAVKAEETNVLNSDISRREEALGRVNTWEKRIEGVRSQLSGYNGPGGSDSGEGEGGGEEAMELAELRTEERAVENEIREMEDRLAQMRARKRWLGERINEGVNRREARLSSYRGALREVESEVKEFLARPPIPVSVVMNGQEGFTTLLAHRRTLEMAKDWWNKEISHLQTRKAAVEKEKSALEKGVQMWEDSIQVVTEFEDDLRLQMASDEVQDAEMLRNQISKMRTVIEKLEETWKVAEDRGWNLLICAVGAELEAFKEGYSILKGALGTFESTNGQRNDINGVDGVDDRNASTNGLEELNGELERSSEREDSEDDGPDLAELLVDRGDHDDS
jgi:DNA repair exonuclease SbcCD ATPase subunit